MKRLWPIGTMRKMMRQTIMWNLKWKSDMTAEDRFNELFGIMQNVIRFELHPWGKCTKPELIARKLIAYQMRQDGFPVVSIGKVLGRNYSTIVTHTNEFKEILKCEDKGYLGYYEEARYWKQFSELVRQADEKKEFPVFTRNNVMTLGEFREQTEGLPDDVILKITDESAAGFYMRPSYDKGKLLICTK